MPVDEDSPDAEVKKKVRPTKIKKKSELFCETCERIKPRIGKAVKGWKCGDCKPRKAKITEIIKEGEA